ncbi:MAG: chemotaxis response regulator protein-glutamate methylesterase [Gammaproteobacteria bacterium]|nr:chemotaxis response regulator protein-glutamate methylesterase [Gammaproteobacteria bacterium]
MDTAKKKVLIVDDSPVVRGILREILAGSTQLEVVGEAEDPYDARDKIKSLHPDVITLDVEMPRMDGITFLENLMRLRPLPVVMISTLTAQGADVTLRALELGAVDFIEKPQHGLQDRVDDFSNEVIAKVVGAAGARVSALASKRQLEVARRPAQSAPSRVQPDKSRRPAAGAMAARIVAIGASTGGTEAIKTVLRQLPVDMPGIVISQHIPAAFSGPFAKRVNGECELSVCEAQDGQEILPGHVYIAPGDRHLMVRRRLGSHFCRLDDGPKVNRHKPSVDVMLESLASCKESEIIAVMLTGMGTDGACGMERLKALGATTLVQDERSSVVWGMPGEVVKRGAADEVLDLQQIAERLVQLACQ